MLTQAEIEFFTAALPEAVALIKAIYASHSAGTMSLADAQADIAGGLAGLASMTTINEAENAKLHEAFESNTPVPDGK